MPAIVFLNYRRSDEAGYALALQASLEKHLPDVEIFMDVAGSIEPGEDFVEAINRSVGSCVILLAVIGPRWLELLTSRTDAGPDFVEYEISSALGQGKIVIPILINGATMPRAQQLPSEIESLSRRNPIHLRLETFKAECLRFAEHLKARLNSIKNVQSSLDTDVARRIALSPEPTVGTSLAGTSWQYVGTNDVGHMILNFLEDGHLHYSYPLENRDFDNGRWTQDGALVVFDMNDHYATYTAKIQGDRMSGNAKNVAGLNWTFAATRAKA